MKPKTELVKKLLSLRESMPNDSFISEIELYDDEMIAALVKFAAYVLVTYVFEVKSCDEWFTCGHDLWSEMCWKNAVELGIAENMQDGHVEKYRLKKWVRDRLKEMDDA